MYNEKIQPRLAQLTDMKESTVLKYNETKDKLWLVKDVGFSSAKTALIHKPLYKLSQTVERTLKAADLVVDKLLPQSNCYFPVQPEGAIFLYRLLYLIG